MIKKLNLTLLVFILFITIVVVPVQAESFNLNVKSSILIEAETGQVLYEENADEKLPPASITKIMALLIAMEKIEKGALSLEDEVTVSQYAESMGGSQIYLPANVRVKVKDLLEAVTIASANDASVAIAEAIAGSYSGFIDMMNERAKELGMNNTHFMNSTGLPEKNHYSTARDISIMARELVKYKQVLKWGSTWVDYIKLPERKAMLANTNRLLNKYPGLDGLKTGHTDAAGFCLTATAKRDQMRLVSVVLKAETRKERQEITTKLLDYGFNYFSKKTVVNKGEKIQNIEIPQGKKTTTVGKTIDDLKVMIKRGQGDNATSKIIIKDSLQAPIKKGEVLGQKVVSQNQKQVGTVNIVATEAIDRANLLVRIWRGFVNWIGSWLQNI